MSIGRYGTCISFPVCRARLRNLRDGSGAGAFHLLQPHSVGADRLRELIARGGLAIWFLEQDALTRAFELMETYADHPMDLADVTLVAAAERLATRRIFTLDRGDFTTFRVRLGHRHYAFEMIV